MNPIRLTPVLALIAFGICAAIAPQASAMAFNFSYSNAGCGWCDSFTGSFDGDIDAADPTGNRLSNVSNLMLATGTGNVFDFSTIVGTQVSYTDRLSFNGLDNNLIITSTIDPAVVLSFQMGGAAVLSPSGSSGVSLFWNSSTSTNGDAFTDGVWSVTARPTLAAVSSVPEPGAASLFSMGVLVVGALLRRGRRP